MSNLDKNVVNRPIRNYLDAALIMAQDASIHRIVVYLDGFPKNCGPRVKLITGRSIIYTRVRNEDGSGFGIVEVPSLYVRRRRDGKGPQWTAFSENGGVIYSYPA